MVSVSIPAFRYLSLAPALFPQLDELFNLQDETNISFAKLMLVIVFITEAENQTGIENLRNNKRYDLRAFFRDKEHYRMEFFK